MQTVTGPTRNPGNHIESPNEKTFVWIVLLLYILLAGLNIFTHEMWRDELQIWMTARDSNSFQELFSNIKYQGHPPLWYLMLYVLNRVTRNPIWMQVVHFLTAAASAGIFLRFAPFSRVQRLLFVFGYFPVYEYAAISRNYAAGIFLLFCFCVFCGDVGKNFRILSIILFFACMANAYTFIITICLLAAIGFKAATEASIRADLIRKKWSVLLCIILVASGLGISGAVMYPKPDCQYASGWVTGYDSNRMEKTFATPWQGLVPIPEIKHSYWNSNIITQRVSPEPPPEQPPVLLALNWDSNTVRGLVVQDILSVILLSFFLLSLAGNRTVFIFFALVCGAILIFHYIVHIGYMRHFGHFFIVVIVCLWLEKIWGRGEPARRGLFSRIGETLSGPRKAIIFALLIIHLGVGIFASIMEWRYPFSEGKHAAEYIKKNGLDRMPIAGYMDFIVSTVSGYLDRQIYYPNSDGLGTFVMFDNKRKMTMETAEVLAKVRQLSDREGSDVLMILHYKLEEENDTIVPLAEFTESLQGDENFYLYLMKNKGR